MTEMHVTRHAEQANRPLRLGFLGTGWIGRHRMQAILATGLAEAVALADPSPDMAREALAHAPSARLVDGLDALLSEDLDGLVIATPSAGHAAQSIAALEAGLAVFCQKPLGRSAAEARAVVEAARAADRLLGVDFSYRETEGLKRIRSLVAEGALGHVFAADFTFHNAYGPDKPWFYDKTLSGGGCVMDLGVHLADMALWLLGETEIASVTSTLMKDGAPLKDGDVEDYAVAHITLASGAVVRLACSWRLQAGADAVIEANLYGTQGGAGLRNLGGSFYDFTTERFEGTARTVLTEPPEDWGGRAAAAWAHRLALSPRYDPSNETLITVSSLIDRIYARR